MRSHVHGQLLGAMLVAAIIPAHALGQTNDEANASLRFDFSNPGARSLGMGGAFVALADDATTAYANPAGLVNVLNPQVAVEGRYTSASDSFVFGGGEPPATGNGVDTLDGLVLGEADVEEQIRLGFLSYVHPWDRRWGRMALAGYRQELSSLDQAFASQGAFFQQPCGGPGEPTCESLGGAGGVARSRHRPVESQTDLEIVNYGAAFAVTLGRERAFSIGLGVAYYEFEMLTQSNRFTLFDKFGEDADRDGLDDLVDFDNLPLSSSTTQFGDDRAFALNVGMFWRVKNRAWIGATFREGPEFDLIASTRVLNRDKPGGQPRFPGDYRSRIYLPGELPASVVATLDKPNPNADLNEEIFPAKFKVPDVYAVGFACRPIDPLTLSFEYNYIDYAQLADLSDLFQVFIEDASESRRTNNFEVDPASVFRLGVEWVFQNGLSLRGGAWYDPDHEISYASGTNQDRKVHFLQGEDEIHYSAGLGWRVSERIDMSAAMDVSDRVTQVSFFTVIETGRQN